MATKSGGQPPPKQDLSFLSSLELKVFHKAIANYKINDEFLAEDATALHWIFGPMFLQVLEFVDEDAATVLKSSGSSGRILVRVYGHGGQVYYIPGGSCLCQCIAYLRGKKEYCKHILAAHIAFALQPEEEYEEIAESEMINIFINHIKKKNK